MSTQNFEESIDIVEAAKRLCSAQQDTIILDVREQDEWDFCHIAGSLHIPMQQIPINLEAIPKDSNVLVLCHHGGRSLRVTRYLRAQGYDKVQNIAGGIEQWAIQVDNNLKRY